LFIQYAAAGTQSDVFNDVCEFGQFKGNLF